jgi:DNA repair exonuclease SbcCD ATPase subunit
MIIKTVELSNYRQHEYLKVDLTGNLIGVLGENGSGKSHFMHAIEFGFAGKVSGQNKSDMLRWGAEEGFVRILFEHNGVDGEIYRELQSNKAQFKFGKEKVTGITKVNAAIAETTGLDADICKQAVFVHQKEVDAVLFTEPSQRQLAWQRLCGLGDASATHSKLGSFISALPEVDDYTEQINEGLERIAEVNDELRAAQESLQITDMGALRPEEIEAAIRKVSELRNAIDAGTTESAVLAEDQKRLYEAQNRLREVEGQLGGYLDDPAEVLKAAADRMNEAVTSLASQRRLHQFEAEKGTVEESLAVLHCPCTSAEVEQYEQRLAEVAKTHTAAATNLDMTQALVSAIKGVGDDVSVCPLCRQKVDRNLAGLAETNLCAARDAVALAAASLEKAGADLSNAKTGLRNYEYQKAALDQKLASVNAQIDEVTRSITVHTNDAEVAQLRQKVDELQASLKAKQDLEIKKSGFENQVLTLSHSVQQRGQHVETILNKAMTLMQEAGVPGADKIDARQQELEANAAKCREVSQELARLTGQITALEKSLDNLNSTVETLREREEKQAALKSIIDTLTAVRQWFHYEHGPQAVINSLLERITSGVNDFLDRFGASFYAIPDFGTTSFKYWYTDGRESPPDGYPSVQEMSGGEAVVLAVSFRFATYCLFASRIGLLTLDEPTVYLDDKNIGCFCNLLNRVKELAADMNLQILISTHERAVMPFMDSTVKFGTYQTEENEDEREDGTEEAA